MNRRQRITRTIFTIALCVLLAGCGLLGSIRSGWSGTRPFIQTLVTQQVITQEKATAAIRDVDDVLAQADVAERCVDSITSSGNEKKVAKAHCYFTFAQSFRTVLARHNIGGSPRLDQIAAIGEGFIIALEEYFHRVTSPAQMTQGGGTSDPDKLLEAAVKSRRTELRAITGK